MRLAVIDLDLIDAERERLDKQLFSTVKGLKGKHIDNNKVARMAALRWVLEHTTSIVPHIDKAFTAGSKFAMKTYGIDYMKQDIPCLAEFKNENNYEEEHLKQPT